MTDILFITGLLVIFFLILPVLFWVRDKLEGLTARINESNQRDIDEIKRLTEKNEGLYSKLSGWNPEPDSDTLDAIKGFTITKAIDDLRDDSWDSNGSIAIKDLEEWTHSNYKLWTKATDQLPEVLEREDRFIIARFSTGSVETVSLHDWLVNSICEFNATITHWMPIPPIPELRKLK